VKDEGAKEDLHNYLGKVSYAVPNYGMETVRGDFKVKVGKEFFFIQHVEGSVFTTK
jgi:hypothetical protein